jgi:site-specific DNA-cytosine methylase
MADRTFRAGFLFCGLGAGALGFLRARASLGDDGARFVSVGGVDIDAEACADFERITGSKATRADVATMTPEELRAAWGESAPDCVFLSPPCKGFSGLLSAASAAKPEYQALNQLVLQGVFLLVEAWPDAAPSTIVIENVPRIVSRGAELLAQVRDLLTAYGYRLHEGMHDCGEVGGLAQHRRRYLLVARRERAVRAFIYRPAKQRVRPCGDVLSTLPVPLSEDAAEFPMHALPRLSWLTWVRLSLIPPGGDWRDLPGVVEAGQQRRAVWARYDVRGWSDPARTVAGEGSNGGFGVADPRVDELALGHEPRRGTFGVVAFDEPAPTVRGRSDVRTGPAAVADPRLAEVVGLKQSAKGAASFKGRPGLFGVADWTRPTSAVTGSASATGSNGTAAIADPRIIEQAGQLGCRPWPRSGMYGVLSWQEAADTITGNARVDNGRFAVADPRSAPPTPPVIRAASGCWHRPMSTMELAALQGLPAKLDGEPLRLAGTSVNRWRERIGNAVPVGAAQAIGHSILLALLAAALGTWTLGSSGIWVREDGRNEHEWRIDEAGPIPA